MIAALSILSFISVINFFMLLLLLFLRTSKETKEEVATVMGFTPKPQRNGRLDPISLSEEKIWELEREK